jgi:aryl-alcohol dehydrogenase-like predicted oxidoreductase
MEYRPFGQTGLNLSVIGLGGLLAHYEGRFGRPSSEEKQCLYRRAAECGINLFDMGYGDEVDIPEELKGPRDDLHFALKAGAPPPDALPPLVERHLRNLRREALDILRLHYYAYREVAGLAEAVERLKQAGKVRALCLIRHLRADQEAYAAREPDPGADGDLVIYNYVCRWQEPGLALSGQAGQGVLIMKALGGQWLSWEAMTTADWSAATKETVIALAGAGEQARPDLELIYPIVAGPRRALAAPGEAAPTPPQALRWVLAHPSVTSILVAVANVAELEAAAAAG